jgi:hypothetical protein
MKKFSVIILFMTFTELFGLLNVPPLLVSASVGVGIILAALAVSRPRAFDESVEGNSEDSAQQPQRLQEPAVTGSPSSASELADNPQAEQRRYFVGKGISEPESSDGPQGKQDQTPIELKSIFPKLSLR